MPIIYIHGVNARDHGPDGEAPAGKAYTLLGSLLENITWAMVEPCLRRFVAPEISAHPESVALVHAYWGDLGAQLAWGGACFQPGESVETNEILGMRLPPSPRMRLITEIRQPLNQLGARFFGDVFTYLNARGDATMPGPIPARILTALLDAQKIKDRTGEPIIVLSNSMGGQLMYDIVTYFLPRVADFSHVRVDFWCSVAAQIGLFEELKLFLSSSDEYGIKHKNRVPFPDRKHLGYWWNVWDADDIISYSVRDIIEDVDDMPFRVGGPILKEHIGYLQSDDFYNLFAERIRNANLSAGSRSAERPG